MSGQAHPPEVPRSQARVHVADFHIHTDRSHDGAMDPAAVVRLAIRRGLTAIAVCDHNTVSGALAARASAAATGSCILVIIGEEIRTSEGEIIGYFLDHGIEPHLTPEQTVAAIKDQGGLVCVPHPFDRYRRSPLRRDALERIAADIDLIEGVNARNLKREDDRRATEWAASRGIAITAGSDAHTPGEIGNVRVTLPWFDDAAGLVRAAPRADFDVRASGLLPHVATAWTKRTRARRSGG